MTATLILIAELLGLYLLAKLTTKKLYLLLLLLTGHRTLAATIVTIILFPGTVIHELSHLFIAEILGVKTGKLTLVPEDIRETELQTGSVTIVTTDPFRRALVGLAPFFTGLVALSIVSFFSSQYLTQTGGGTNSIIVIAVTVYFLYAIAASMFPSEPDMKGTPSLLLTIILFLVAGYVVGIRVGFTDQILAFTNTVVDGLIKNLATVLTAQILLFIILQIFIALTGKIAHRRIVSP